MDLFDLFKMDWSAVTAVDFTTMTPYELGRNVLLPFVLVYIILWAILEKFRMFPKKVNVILSLGISLLLATTPAYTILAAYITQVSGSSMIIIFAVLLVGGTLMWALGRGREIYYETETDKLVLQLRKKIQKLRKKYSKKRDPAILDQINKMEARIKQLEYEARREKE